MSNPIVYTQTSDGLDLYGIYFPAKDAKSIWIHTHGTASNFYEEDFVYAIAEELNKIGISVLSVNNRGNAVLQIYPKEHGAATEKFEDCIIDFDAWIKFAKEKGYSRIFLSGHSLGTQKVIYYMNKGTYKDEVKGISLLAFADSYSNQQNFLKNIGKDLLSEAQKLVNDGKRHEFLTNEWHSHSGVLPKNANSYLNFFSKDSELSKALPLREKRLEMYSKIKIPILAIVGDQDHYTVLPVQEALDLLKSENSQTEGHLIENCEHDFIGHEEEVASLMRKFLERINK